MVSSIYICASLSLMREMINSGHGLQPGLCWEGSMVEIYRTLGFGSLFLQGDSVALGCVLGSHQGSCNSHPWVRENVPICKELANKDMDLSSLPADYWGVECGVSRIWCLNRSFLKSILALGPHSSPEASAAAGNRTPISRWKQTLLIPGDWKATTGGAMATLCCYCPVGACA